MRKKIFATLMSVAMVASFMPSLAFATATAPEHEHAYAVTVKAGNVVDWQAVQDAKNLPNGDLIDVVKAPTCTEDGEAVLTCINKNCDAEYAGHSITVTIENGHKTETKKFSAKELADQLYSQDAAGWGKKACAAFVAADAKDKTYCYYTAEYCKVCNKIVGTIPAPASVTTDSNVVKAVEHKKVATTGCNTKDKCLECGTLVDVKDPSAARPHTPSTTEYVKIKDATCTEKAKEAPVCTKCGEPVLNDPEGKSLVRDVAKSEPLGHNLTHAEVTKAEATDGTSTALLKKGYFSVTECDLDAFGNKGTKYYKAVDSTGTTGAATDTTCPADEMGVKCANCGKFVNFGTNNTVKASELKTVAANDLNETAKYTKAASKHDFAVVKEVPATCGHNAYTLKECKVCDHRVRDEKVNTALKHDYKVTEVKGDCTQAGKVVISCKNCNTKETITSATDLGSTENQTKYTKVGNTWYFKGFNGELVSFIALPAISTGNGAHKWESYALYKEANCQHGEIWARKCKNCGKIDPSTLTYKGIALKHNLEKVEVAATCGTEGYYVEKCTLCKKYKNATNAAIDAETIATAAKFKTADPVVKEGTKCTVDKWIVTKEATVFDEGVKTLGCSVCGHIDENAPKTVVEKKKVGTPVVKLTSKKGKMIVKASAADNATGYEVTYKRAGKKATTKTYTAESISKTYRLLKGKKYTVTVTAFASNGTDTVKGETVTKTITIKK